MIRALYSSLMWLAQPFLRRKLARRGQAEPGYRVAVEERFGRYSAEAPQGLVWLHAVSLGETRAAAPPRTASSAWARPGPSPCASRSERDAVFESVAKG